MIIVADASVLVAQLLRQQGRVLLADPRLDVVVAAEQWDETLHAITRRLAVIVRQGRLSPEQADQLSAQIPALRLSHLDGRDASSGAGGVMSEGLAAPETTQTPALTASDDPPEGSLRGSKKMPRT